MEKKSALSSAPRGLAILAVVGPAFVWCAEYIGSGEVILATRMGAILGYAILWAPIIGIILKTFIGAGGAHYTVCTGEGMVDMFGRMPGKGKWVVWVVLIAEICAGAMSGGSIASAAGMFAHSIIPLKPFIWGWILTAFAIFVVWSGTFDIIKYVMSVFVFFVILGVIYVAFHSSPGFIEIARGMVVFSVPEVPDWAQSLYNVSSNPWNEILPLIGWAAGGFASQVWYTYWVLGAGYGMASGRSYGQSCDTAALKQMTLETARKVKGWCRVVYVDAFVAMVIGIVVTSGFLLAGAGILRPEHIAPEGPSVAIELSVIFSRLWGKVGAMLFIMAGCAALTSTLIGQFAGWPRLLADSVRICFPKFSQKFSWQAQFRMFVALFCMSNILIVYTLGIKPVFIIQISAVLEGLLLTPFQAVAVLIGLVWVMPRLVPKEAYAVLKPGWVMKAGLVISTLVFGYFCFYKIPAYF